MQHTRTRGPAGARILVAAALALASGVAVAPAAGATPAAPPRSAAPPRPAAHPERGWVGAWEASPAVGLSSPTGAESGSSVREVVHLSAGGAAVRIRLSNRFGTAPLTLGHVTVAVRAADGAGTAHGKLREVTFHGARSATVPAGADVTADPALLPVRPGADLLVTVYLPVVSGPVTTHPLAQQTSYYAPGGDHADDVAGDAYTGTFGQWYYLTGVDVFDPPTRGSLVTLGDSITDGADSTAGENHRWPDYLARRIQALPPSRRLGVLNAGISGNRLLLDGGSYGVNALARFDEDVLSRTGVRTLIVLEGINDIQQSPHQTDPAKITAAYEAIAARAHARGIKVIGATLTPFKGWQVYDDTLEATREAVNAYIRTSRTFDAVIDFDAATRDPADPLALRPEYDSGDHLHPNDAGYRAMAEVVDLADL
ncbi:SGNH/GDSL hydrolase family protein [Actinoallomurus rhizosphaericola]|uniref:SGNH/GDSL hydrolase family protein n=1 Tax=Actinoallomurus rhizosphaericola TaxID=2952536 RepID=UPI0020928C43|nr:SGNH/GDSL hydrolase family protein [Actinoallomurus rhizosphaericola]MCO5999728.1 SGNH/GDSL hydrolase family protein [Actinoallomurus rhizosphaericola]